MINRTRRTRSSQTMRDLVANVTFSLDNLVYPIFVEEGQNIKKEIPSMPGQFRLSIDNLKEELQEIKNLGIKSLLVFGIPEANKKDPVGTEAYNDNGIVQEAVRFIKKEFPEFLLITDVCMCEYTSHGHCGLLNGEEVLNDETVELLCKIAISHVKAGADMVAPSDMMDGRIAAMRKALDKEGFVNVPIMAYSIKYASSYYGPFRDAADSAPSFGDRKAYQMDYRNSKDYLIEARNDINEGADIIMVKPGMPYLDVVKAIADSIDLPVAVYNVSGEYSMVKAASQMGWIDEKKIVMENMYAMRRAGASIIITYHAKDIAKWMEK
ncbi:porphobilinogen synthase [Cetobacterium ceti]|uniref:Delta-aminolevulinic acid dehydratase n=1 Tax=Cetobacterium ceti TaxID=180163 RepID=A0A1T4PLQ5_9FUSO|nr:porphobilinogen synthase [Cetobacterium ceti]SJZ92480.1 porphobilinogen synthase [Cetobacterium ceti]